ncbi:hypothetical protein DIPPA_00806 [Diplonema papillatum]|nr:hypothetical protein DIPPA_00806 [Diplonema papillatum]
MAGHCRIRVIEGRQLCPMDALGSADSYIKVIFNDQTRETRTSFRSLNPKWDQSPEHNNWTFMHQKKVNTITLEAYDYDAVGKDNFMGAGFLQLGTPGKASSGTDWVHLQPLPGDEETAAMWRKYGTLGEVKVEYSYSYYPLSRYFASEHLIGQLSGVVDGSKPAKRKDGLPDAGKMRQNLSRLSEHAWWILALLRAMSETLFGYRMVAIQKPVKSKNDKAKGTPNEAAPAVQFAFETETWGVELVDEYRAIVFCLATVLLLLPLTQLPFSEQLSKACLPCTILAAYRKCKEAARVQADYQTLAPDDNPFLFLQSNLCFEALYGADCKTVERKAREMKNTVLSGVGSAVAGGMAKTAMTSRKVAVGGINALINEPMARIADSPLGGGRSRAKSEMTVKAAAQGKQKTTSTMDPVSSNDASLTTVSPNRPPLDNNYAITASMVHAAPYVGWVSDFLQNATAVLFWIHQKPAVTLCQHLIVASALFLTFGLSGARVLFWLLFCHVFFMNRLYYTDRALHSKLTAVLDLHGLGVTVWNCVRGLDRVDDGGNDEAAAKASVTAFDPELPPGLHVLVDYEEEAPQGKWVLRQQEAVVVMSDSLPGGCVVVDWGDNSPRFVTKKASVSHIPWYHDAQIDIQSSSQPPTIEPKRESPNFSRGDSVVVSVETDRTGQWIREELVGTVVSSPSSAGRPSHFIISWGDGSPTYRAPAATVSIRHPRASAYHQSKQSADEGTVEAKKSSRSPAEAEACLGRDDHRSDEVSMHNGRGVPVPLNYESRRVPSGHAQASLENPKKLCKGDIVEVSYELKTDMGWVLASEKAKVCSNTHDGNAGDACVVEWLENATSAPERFECPTKFCKLVDLGDCNHTAPPAPTTALSVSAQRSLLPPSSETKHRAGLAEGDVVTVTFEAELAGGGWEKRTDVGTVRKLIAAHESPSGTPSAEVSWNNGEPERYVTPLRLVKRMAPTEWEIVTKVPEHALKQRPTLHVGDVVEVAYEYEVDDKWVSTSDEALVRSVKGEQPEEECGVEWLDNVTSTVEQYVCPAKCCRLLVSRELAEEFVLLRAQRQEEAASDTHRAPAKAMPYTDVAIAPAPGLGRFSVSESVHVAVEREARKADGTVVTQIGSGKIYAITQNYALIDWQDGSELYQAPWDSVSKRELTPSVAALHPHAGQSPALKSESADEAPTVVLRPKPGKKSGRKLKVGDRCLVMVDGPNGTSARKADAMYHPGRLVQKMKNSATVVLDAEIGIRVAPLARISSLDG